MSGCRRNSSATAGVAARVTVTPGHADRSAPIAGVVRTASPSQLTARTSRVPPAGQVVVRIALGYQTVTRAGRGSGRKGARGRSLPEEPPDLPDHLVLV